MSERGDEGFRTVPKEDLLKRKGFDSDSVHDVKCPHFLFALINMFRLFAMHPSLNG